MAAHVKFGNIAMLSPKSIAILMEMDRDILIPFALECDERYTLQYFGLNRMGT